MRYSKEHTDKLIARVLPLLRVTYTETRRRVNRTGRELIAAGVLETDNGKLILPDGVYPVIESVKTEINHKKKLEDLIRKAKSEDNMTTLLGAYVARYTKDPNDLKTK